MHPGRRPIPFLVLLILGCTAPPVPATPPERVISPADHHADVRVAPGTLLRLELPDDPPGPWRWTVRPDDPNMLEEQEAPAGAQAAWRASRSGVTRLTGFAQHACLPPGGCPAWLRRFSTRVVVEDPAQLAEGVAVLGVARAALAARHPCGAVWSLSASNPAPDGRAAAWDVQVTEGTGLTGGYRLTREGIPLAGAPVAVGRWSPLPALVPLDGPVPRLLDSAAAVARAEAALGARLRQDAPRRLVFVVLGAGEDGPVVWTLTYAADSRPPARDVRVDARSGAASLVGDP